jgi:hypothetical protein
MLDIGNDPSSYDLEKRYHWKEEIKTFPVISSEYGLDQFYKWLEVLSAASAWPLRNPFDCWTMEVL